MTVADLASLRRFFAQAPFMQDLGIEPVDGGEGRVVTRLTLAPRHFQHTGAVHAGVMASMADHTMGAAAQTLASEGVWIMTAEFKVNLLRSARGTALVCEARVVKPGRTISFTEARVFAEDAAGQRREVATASATMASVAASQAEGAAR